MMVPANRFLAVIAFCLLAICIVYLAGGADWLPWDLRPGSPTQMEWFGIELSSRNRRMLFIPAGIHELRQPNSRRSRGRPCGFV